MGKSIIRDLIILLIIFGFVWGAISLFPIFPKKVELLSIEKEQELGDMYLEMIMQSPEYTELESNYIDSIVSLIGDSLIAALDETDYEYTFVILDDHMINAFSLPGGNLIITTGLLGFCDTPEELAAVMAHEMGHSEMRHVVSRLIKELGIAILTSGDQFVMGEITKTLTSAGFDRNQERDADEFACELLEKASIEPRTLATFFRKLRDENDFALLDKFEIVSTHPNFASRIRQTLEYKPADDFNAEPMSIDWEKVKAELDRSGV